MTNYVQCYETMIGTNFAFVTSLEAATADQYQEFRSEVWDFFSTVEKNYDCGGFCYEPLFVIAKEISDGRNQTDCIGPVMQRAFGYASWISGFGAFMLFATVGLGTTLFWGMPTKEWYYAQLEKEGLIKEEKESESSD